MTFPVRTGAREVAGVSWTGLFLRLAEFGPRNFLRGMKSRTFLRYLLGVGAWHVIPLRTSVGRS